MADPSAFIARAREVLAKATPGPYRYSAKLSGSENHRGFTLYSKTWWIADFVPMDEDGAEGEANVALSQLALNSMPALLEVAETAVVLRSMVGYDTFGGGAWDTAITALDAALARLAEVPGE